MSSKEIKKLFIYGSIALVLGVIIYLFAFYLSVIDSKDVKIDGYVYDEITKQPINGATVIINNERYESDNGVSNYDEYLGHDVIKLITDKSGHYSTVIGKSAFLWIDLEKEGYQNSSIDGQYSSKTMEYKTFMKKKESSN
ncbi:hypothetical protein [Flavobacterium sp. GCM10027622]|uniref:hypothetical protein n=1 Tax=unclassified Flavobacterium TaxID=196869 RepID=UPI0036200E11